jgi:hypothetical protein
MDYLSKGITMKKALLISLALLSSATNAEQYQSISNLNYNYVKFNNGEEANSTQIDSIYYFEKRNTLGPLDQFSYINQTSNIFGAYSYTDFDNVDFKSHDMVIGGEYYTDNFLIGGRYIYSDNDEDNFNIRNLRLGYLINDDFLVKVDYIDEEDDDSLFVFSADYNYQINSSDYLGFNATSDGDFEYKKISAKYFKKLNGTQTLVTNISAEDFEYSGSVITADVNFYFNDRMSLSGSFDTEDRYSVSGKYFLNKNIAVNTGYYGSTDNKNPKTFNIGLSAQF